APFAPVVEISILTARPSTEQAGRQETPDPPVKRTSPSSSKWLPTHARIPGSALAHASLLPVPYHNRHGVPLDSDRERTNRLPSVADAFPYIDPEPMKRTFDGRPVEWPFGQRSTRMRAAIVDRRHPVADAKDADFQFLVDGNDLRTTIGDVIQLQPYFRHRVLLFSTGQALRSPRRTSPSPVYVLHRRCDSVL